MKQWFWNDVSVPYSIESGWNTVQARWTRTFQLSSGDDVVASVTACKSDRAPLKPKAVEFSCLFGLQDLGANVAQGVSIP